MTMANDPKKNDDLKKVTPQSAPPKEGEKHLVDKSAPADNNIAEIKSGARDKAPEAEAITQQPGDPKVKTNEGGVVVERDATKDEVKSVDARTAPVTVTEADQADDEGDDDDKGTPAITEAQQRDETTDNGGDNGQRKEGDEPEDEPTVELKNPSGRQVTVRVRDIAHQKMFAAGFTTIEGEEYPAEITDLEDAYKNNLHARTIYTDVDQSDPHQSKSKGDIARRNGTKDTGDSDGKPQAKVAAPKNAEKPKSFDGVDQRENGQVVNPKTSNPLKSNRLSQALKS
jgi:hypothetical protein